MAYSYLIRGTVKMTLGDYPGADRDISKAEKLSSETGDDLMKSFYHGFRALHMSASGDITKGSKKLDSVIENMNLNEYEGRQKYITQLEQKFKALKGRN